MKVLNLIYNYKVILICFILITVIFLLFLNLFYKDSKDNLNNDNYEPLWEVKYVKRNRNRKAQSLLPTENKSWNQKEIYQKFYRLTCNNNYYFSKGSTIEAENIDTLIEMSNVIEFDDKNIAQVETAYKYNIKGISNECAIAVQFENDSNFYIYTNLHYTPNTLENLIEDLNLKQTISFKSISYNHKYFDISGNEQYENIEFENIKDNDIWNLLLYDIDLENLYNDMDSHLGYIMTINANISLLCEDISLNITNDGYLTTNILDSEKVFYIGTEKIHEFVNYIIKNYTGYKIVYIYDEYEEEIIENNDTIMKINNTLNY